MNLYRERDSTELVSFIAARIGRKSVRLSLPRMRLSIRSMMLVVVIAAVFCQQVFERRNRFIILAQSHESQIARDFFGNQHWLVGLSSSGKVVTDWESKWHETMAARYRAAAKSPWIPLGPDPKLSDFEKAASQRRAARQKRLIATAPQSLRQKQLSTAASQATKKKINPSPKN